MVLRLDAGIKLCISIYALPDNSMGSQYVVGYSALKPPHSGRNSSVVDSGR